MNNLKKGKLESLYKSGLSIKEISDSQKIPYWTVRYWMSRYGIERRSWSDATYFKRNPEGDPFKVKTHLNKEEIGLKNLGLGIYWGEGDKSLNNTSVRLGNIDPFLIKKFREFLLRIYLVKKEKIQYGLILFNDINELEAIKFWVNHLDIKKEQLGKIVIIPPQGKGTYKRKSQYGVLSIIFTNKKLKGIILEEIKNIH